MIRASIGKKSVRNHRPAGSCLGGADMKPQYRICRKCGKQVNVSSQENHGKKYICPRCTGEPWYMTREELVREIPAGTSKK